MKERESYQKPPDFVQQLVSIGMSKKSIEDMTFHPGDHEFFVKMNDTFQDALRKDMTKLVAEALLSANTVICEQVSKLLADQSKEVGEAYVNMMRAIEGVADDLKEVKEEQKRQGSDIADIKSDMAAMKLRQEQLEGKQGTDADRIARIEEWIKNRKDLEKRIEMIELHTGHIQDWENLPEALEVRFKKLEDYKKPFELLRKRTNPIRIFWWVVGSIAIGGSIVGYIVVQIIRHLHETGALIGLIS